MQKLTPPAVVGGGTKKILYTLSTLKRIGLLQSAKALTSHNACKACGLGMGGQRGGMTNELDEFPSVCNKSVQAQSTDIQPPIPEALFIQHSLADFRELSGREIEKLGRLGTPLFKAADSDHYQPLTWDEALAKAADAMRHALPERSFFYASGRSSNEAGFVLQLLARLYGTNNVTNCSYYCHQATGVAMGNSIGTGTATINLHDLTGCDLIFVIGANPASNHPRFIHKLQALRERGGHVVVINPAKEPGLVKFALPKSPKSLLQGGSAIASEYLQPRIGTDLWLFKGLAKAILEANAADREFIDQHCHDFDAFAADIHATDWDAITNTCGIARSDIERIAHFYAQSAHTVFAWGMGMTHHQNGVENIEYIANLALLRGMIGKPFAGLLPLRGHSNVQGIGTVGVKPELPDYLLQGLEQHFGVKLPAKAGMDTLAALEAAHRGEIDFALMLGGNLYAATPDSQWAAQALDRIGFKLFLTTTLNHGHVTGMDNSASLVLPVTARDEEWQPTTQESMFNYVRLSDGGIKRLHNIRPETDILASLAERVLPDCGVDFTALRSHRYIRETLAKTIPGLSPLASIDQDKQEFHIGGRVLHVPEFHTADGYAHFVTHPTQLPKPTTFPYTLMTVRSEGQFNSIIYEEIDSYRQTDDRWSVLLSPAMISRLGIGETDRVSIRSAHGTMRGLKVFPFDLPDGDVMAYYPEANILVGRERDPRSQTPAFKSIPVSLEVENNLS